MLSDDPQQKADEIGILDLLVAIAEAWIVIVLVPVLAMGVAYLLTRDAVTYTASASIAAASIRVEPVLRDTFPDLVVTSTGDNSTQISVIADAADEARRELNGAIELLANSSFLSETLTDAELAAVAVWSAEAVTLRRSLDRVEASYETSVATDPGSYASAVTLLMTELTQREHDLRKAGIRLSQKVVDKPERVRVAVSPRSDFSARTTLIVGLVAALLTILAVLLRNALVRLDPNAQSKLARIRTAFFLPAGKVSK